MPARDRRIPFGLTPAWAGSTDSPALWRDHTQAHPRMGGEHCDWHDAYTAYLGSPPHGRGALDMEWMRW